VDDLEPARDGLEHVARPIEHGHDVRGRGRERAGDDLLGRPIAAHGVDGDPDGRHLVPLQVMLLCLRVASTKPEFALDRSQG
jgi:hypothetical protein